VAILFGGAAGVGLFFWQDEQMKIKMMMATIPIKE
jgi:hypothetical protein